jgi:para-nitrobenzyl esterase
MGGIGSRPSQESAERWSEVQDVAHIESGALLGTVDGDVLAFKGVPYAAPPVGELRWRPPQPAHAWSGIRPADQYGAIAPQHLRSRDRGVGPPPALDDCLTLNLWTPLQHVGGGLPVMVWIHGGGYATGSGSAPLYDGIHLARRGAVVVTLNYRLGRLGFFAHPALSREFLEEPKGNYGLLDIIAALQWVRRNIAAFGGDAANITLFGQSSGGHAINLLMTSPLADGLFHQAIVQSGGGRDPMARLAEVSHGGLPSAEAQGRAFMASIGYRAETPAALRAIPADAIIAAGDPDDPSIGGGPMIDGRILTCEPIEAFSRGLEAKVPYLIGCNSLEIAGVGPDADAVTLRLAGIGPGAVNQIRAAYGEAEAFERLVAADIIFCEPARTLAKLHARNGQSSWLYRFGFIPLSLRDASRGSPHGAERSYVFGTLNTSSRPPGLEDAALAAALGDYWVNFARRGDPNGEGLPTWPACSPEADRLMAFNDEGPVASEVPFRSALDVLSAHLPQAPTDGPKWRA